MRKFNQSGFKKISVFLLIVIIAGLLIIGGIFLSRELLDFSQVELNETLSTVAETGTDELIGGQRDEHGCLEPAGYAWIEDIGACGRTWELDENQVRAARIAIDYVGTKEGLTVLEALVLPCPGCFVVKLEESETQARQAIRIENWQVVENELNQVDCLTQGGTVINTANNRNCESEQENVGKVTGTTTPAICCVPLENWRSLTNNAAGLVTELAINVLKLERELVELKTVQVKWTTEDGEQLLIGKGIVYGSDEGLQAVFDQYDNLRDNLIARVFTTDELNQNREETDTIRLIKDKIVCNLIKTDSSSSVTPEIELRCADLN